MLKQYGRIAALLTLVPIAALVIACDRQPTLPHSSVGRIAFASIRSGFEAIYAINPDGSGLTRLSFAFPTPLPTSTSTFTYTEPPPLDMGMDPPFIEYADEQPVWSPDGRRIAFVAIRNNQRSIAIMNADGSQLTTYRFTDGVQDPAWSPDGQRIVFVGQIGSSKGIYVVNTDGSKLTKVASVGGGEHPTWSPDGQRIAFGSRSDERIYVMMADGSEITALNSSSAPLYSVDPAWSPDGRHIAFTGGNGDPDNGIYVMAIDGSNPIRLTTSRFIEQDIAWSPDGQRIGFEGEYNGKHGIFIINADVTHPIQVINDASISGLSWGAAN